MPNVSRRSFLLASTAAAGAALLDLTAGRAAEGSQDFGGWPVGIQSYTLRKFNTAEALRHVEGLGLHYIEFFGAHFSPDASDEQIAQMKKTLTNAGIKLNAHGVNGFGKDHEANRKLFEFARKAGFRNLTANPAPDAFDSLDKLVDEYNIRIAIHNHGPGALYDGLETVTQRLEGRHKLIGACIDTGHVLRSGGDPVAWTRALGNRVFALHLKDVAEKQDRTHDVVLGEGHLDMVGLFRALKEIKFPADGSLSVEYESNPDNPVEDVRQCLVVTREAIAKATG